MKASFVSSSSISQALRYSVAKSQAALVNAQKELSTGWVADKGLTFGARMSQSINFNRELERMESIVSSNALATTRLTATQDGLDQINSILQSFMSLLTSASSSTTISVTKDAATDTLKRLTSVLNTNLNGEYLFAGINTDAKPIDDFFAEGSQSKAAYDAAYAQYLADTGADPDNPFPTAADMDTFMDTYVEPLFLGAEWSNWSSASDQSIVNRISLNETVETSASANDGSMRKLAMATTIISQLLSDDLPVDVRKSLIDRAHKLVAGSLGDLVNLQSRTGLAEKRVTDASERLTTQTGLIEKHIVATESVDPLEAKTRVDELLTRIQESYALTARLQQLSLLKFLS